MTLAGSGFLSGGTFAREIGQLPIQIARDHCRVWYYERDSVPGLSYLIQVCEAIEQCQVLILVVSRDSMGSHQVDAEIVRAHETTKYWVSG
jgi:TIR domain